MKSLIIIFLFVVNVALCQNIDEVQLRIDSLNFARMNLLKSVELVDREILKQKKILTTLKGLKFEKSLTVVAIKNINVLDDKSIANGKIIATIKSGESFKLINFDGNYYYSEFNNQFGYIYYPYLNDIKNLEEFKIYWVKRTKELLVKEKTELTVQQKTDRFKSLSEKYGYDNARLIMAKNLKIGMSKEMVIESIGNPKSKNISNYSFGTHEQWVYKDKYVYIENGILTSWQDEQ